MHGFQVYIFIYINKKISTSDVCKIVFVCEETLWKRLEEFKETDVAKLT